MKIKKEVVKYSYWTIEKVGNGYLVRNSGITVVFNSLTTMLDYLKLHTK